MTDTMDTFILCRDRRSKMTAYELIEALRLDNPGRRYAVHKRNGEVQAIAIDGPNGWDMFAAGMIDGTWTRCSLRVVVERGEWQEVPEGYKEPERIQNPDMWTIGG